VVLAHEIGTRRSVHVPLRLAATFVSGLAVAWLLGWPWASRRCSGPSASPHLALPPRSLLLIVFRRAAGGLLRPGFLGFARQEHAATGYAYAEAGCGETSSRR